MSASASNVTVTVKFSQAYVSNYATLTDPVTVLFIAAYKGYINSALGANAPSVITVTSITSGSTVVVSVFTFGGSSSAPSASTISSNIQATTPPASFGTLQSVTGSAFKIIANFSSLIISSIILFFYL